MTEAGPFGHTDQAYTAYTKAIDLSHDTAERRFLTQARDALGGQ